MGMDTGNVAGVGGDGGWACDCFRGSLRGRA